MARPRKLTDKQHSEIQRRHVGGETTRVLAKAFKVSQATVSNLVSGRTKTIKTLAASIVRDEQVLESLPVSDQLTVRNLTDQLRGISDGLAAAANYNAQTSAHLAGIANRKATLLGDASHDADLKAVAMYLETSNRASTIGLNLINANKDKATAGDLTLEQLVTGEAR
jgi:hypothetical protein